MDRFSPCHVKMRWHDKVGIPHPTGNKKTMEAPPRCGKIHTKNYDAPRNPSCIRRAAPKMKGPTRSVEHTSSQRWSDATRTLLGVDVTTCQKDRESLPSSVVRSGEAGRLFSLASRLHNVSSGCQWSGTYLQYFVQARLYRFHFPSLYRLLVLQLVVVQIPPANIID
jgi:hypothetical protein